MGKTGYTQSIFKNQNIVVDRSDRKIIFILIFKENIQSIDAKICNNTSIIHINLNSIKNTKLFNSKNKNKEKWKSKYLHIKYFINKKNLL